MTGLSHLTLDNIKDPLSAVKHFYSLKLLFLLSLKQSPKMESGNSSRRK